MRLTYACGVLLLLSACAVPSEPTETAVLHPEFRKTTPNGGGGGSGGGGDPCQLFQHNTGRCPTLLGQAIVTTGLTAWACYHGPTPACLGGAPATATVWTTWREEPDANGIPYDEPYAGEPRWPTYGE